MPAELKEGLTRVSSDLLGPLRMVWQSISRVPSPALTEGGISSMTPTDESRRYLSLQLNLFIKPISDFECSFSNLNICGAVPPIVQKERNLAKLGMLNCGQCIDFVLQETSIESFNK